MNLVALPAFADNYIWLLHDGQQALVVDPGDAQPVRAALQRWNLRLQAILVTHHHADHIGGVAALRATTQAPVYGPAKESIPGPYTALGDGEVLESLGLQFEALEVPGHTAGHLAFYAAKMDGAPLLFCGDTLFSAGCGRLLGGSPAQMLASLDKLAALPGNTRVCCAHEYTLSNLAFAAVVDSANPKLAAYTAQARALRAEHLPTLPSTLATERAINPFLRTREPALVQSAQRVDASATDEVSVFTALRNWKNTFRP